MKRHSFFLDKV